MKIISGQVVGVRVVNYKNRAGKEVDGQELFITFDPKDSELRGIMAGSVFNSFRDGELVYSVGDDCQVAYDKYGMRKIQLVS